MSLRIYHNPRCSKSRQALDLLNEKGLNPEVIEYLKAPPSAQELDALLKALKAEPRQIVRDKEGIYRELGLAEKALTREEWIEVLVKHPILIERPIVVCGKKAVVARPPEKALEIL
ncbi:MAG: arsenate reductase (glutaredoxin) [bacterium]